MRPNSALARADRTAAQSSSRRTLRGAVALPALFVAALVAASHPLLAGVTTVALLALWKYARCVLRRRRRAGRTSRVRVPVAGVRIEA